MKPARKSEILVTSFRKFLPFISLIVICLILSLLRPRFLTWENISNIIRQHAQIIIMAIGMTFVIVSQGIDLSVGSMMALAGVCGTLLLTIGVPIVPAIVGGCFAGLICGLLNGLFISRLKISPFIATLGTMQVFRGLVLQITKGLPVYRDIPPAFDRLRNGNLSDLVRLGLFDSIPIVVIAILLIAALAMLILRRTRAGKYLFADRIPIALILALLIATVAIMMLRLRRFMPIPLILILLVAVLANLMLRYTRLGRYSYAIGSNVEAAHHSGIRVGAYIVLIYAVCGFLAGFAGMIHFSSLGSGVPTEGVGYELKVIAAVVIGGGSLMGGEGTVSGTIAGALFMAILLNACVHLQISDFVQQIVIGGLLVLAVALDQRLKRKMEGGGL